MRAISHHRLHHLHQRTTCIGHVADEDGNAVLHIANKNHARHFIRTSVLFMDKSEVEAEAVGDGGGSVGQVNLIRLLESYLSSNRCCKNAGFATFLHPLRLD